MVINHQQYRHMLTFRAEYFLLAVLSLPLAFSPFFFKGSSLEFRPVVICLEQIFVVFYVALNFQEVLSRSNFALRSLCGKFFIAWFLSSLVSVLFSANLSLSLVRQAEWFSHILFAFCVWIFINKNKWVQSAGYMVFLFGFVIVCADIGVFWFFLDNPSGYPWTNETPHFSHIRHFSYYCSAATTILFFMGQNNSARKDLVSLYFLLLSVSWGYLVWSGGRAAVGATLLGVTVSVLLFMKRKKAFYLLVFFTSFCSGLLLASHFSVNAKWVGFANAYVRTVEAPSVNSLLSGRIYIWENTLSYLLESPFWGLGPDMFRTLDIMQGISQPHNFIIQFLVEWGFIGTVLFCTFNTLLLKRAVVSLMAEDDNRPKYAKIASCTLILNFIILGLTDGTFYHALPLMLTSYAYAVLLVRDNVVTSSAALPLTGSIS